MKVKGIGKTNEIHFKIIHTIDIKKETLACLEKSKPFGSE